MEQTITLFDLSDINGKGMLQLSNISDYAKSGLTIKKVWEEFKTVTADAAISELSQYKVFARQDIPVDMGRKINRWIAKKALFINAAPLVAERILKLIIRLVIESEEIDVNKAFFVWKKHRQTYRSLGNIAHVHQKVEHKVKKAKKTYTNWYMEEHKND